MPRQHCGERGKDLAHLRRLVWKDVRRIHVVHDGGVVRLKHQEFAVLVLGAIDDEIIEADAPAHLCERRAMACCKGLVEVKHEDGFLRPLLLAERHIGVEIPDVPAVGDRHVAGIGPAVDHRETIFAIETVRAHIVDEARDEEVLLVAPGNIGCERRRVVELGEADAGMRAARPRDHRKAELARDLSASDPPFRQIRQLRTCGVHRCRNVEPGHTGQQPMQLVAVEIGDAIGAVEQRPRQVGRSLLD